MVADGICTVGFKASSSLSSDWFDITNFKLIRTGDLPGPMIIEANNSKSWNEYLWGDIIFGSTDDAPTGQLLLDVSGKVNGKVKLQKTITADRWYSIGFPFDVNVYYEDELLTPYDPSSGGHFWLKTYDGDKFDYAPEIEADQGYIVQFPTWFDSKEVTFVSKLSSHTLVGTVTQTDIPSSAGYHLVAHPSVSNLDLTTPNRYYTYNQSANRYELLAEGTKVIQPFEAVIVAENISGALKSSISAETDIETGLDRPVNDTVISIRYYNLSGIEQRQPVENGISIVKKIYSSGKTEVTKELIIY
jgi:hypothetical protein